MIATTTGRRYALAALAGIVWAGWCAPSAQAFFPPPRPGGGTGGVVITDPPEPPPTVSIPPLPDDPFVPQGTISEVPNPPTDCACPPNTNNTPEPASLVMGLLGLAVVGGLARRKRR